MNIKIGSLTINQIASAIIGHKVSRYIQCSFDVETIRGEKKKMSLEKLLRTRRALWWTNLILFVITLAIVGRLSWMTALSQHNLLSNADRLINGVVCILATCLVLVVKSVTYHWHRPETWRAVEHQLYSIRDFMNVFNIVPSKEFGAASPTKVKETIVKPKLLSIMKKQVRCRGAVLPPESEIKESYRRVADCLCNACSEVGIRNMKNLWTVAEQEVREERMK